jgi:hypothetical protein
VIEDRALFRLPGQDGLQPSAPTFERGPLLRVVGVAVVAVTLRSPWFRIFLKVNREVPIPVVSEAAVASGDSDRKET